MRLNINKKIMRLILNKQIACEIIHKIQMYTNEQMYTSVQMYADVQMYANGLMYTK